MADYGGNSEGSIYLGQDGNAYQVINGKDVQVSNDKLIIPGYKPLPDTITVDGITFHWDEHRNVYLFQNGRYVPISEPEIQKLNAERFGGQLEARLEQEGRKQQEKPNYVLYAGVALVILLVLKG